MPFEFSGFSRNPCTWAGCLAGSLKGSPPLLCCLPRHRTTQAGGDLQQPITARGIHQPGILEGIRKEAPLQSGTLPRLAPVSSKPGLFLVSPSFTPFQPHGPELSSSRLGHLLPELLPLLGGSHPRHLYGWLPPYLLCSHLSFSGTLTSY